MDNKTLNIIVGGMFDPMSKKTIDLLNNLDFIEKTNLYGNPRQIFRDVNIYDKSIVEFNGRLGFSFFTNTGPTGLSFIKNNIKKILKDNGYFAILSETAKKNENLATILTQIASEIFIYSDEDNKRFISYGRVRENPFSPNPNGKKLLMKFLGELDEGQNIDHFTSFLKEAVKEEDNGVIQIAAFENDNEMLLELQSKNPNKHQLKITEIKKPIAPMPMNLEIALKCATSGIVDGVLNADGELVHARVFSKVIKKKNEIETSKGKVETHEEIFMIESFAAWEQGGDLIYAKAF